MPFYIKNYRRAQNLSKHIVLGLNTSELIYNFTMTVVEILFDNNK